jgi:AraC-like DNA-binding protein
MPKPKTTLPQPKSVTNALAQMALRASVQRGMGAREFYRLTGISEGDLRAPGGRIPAARHVAMLNLTEPAWTSGVFPHAIEVPLGTPFSTLLGVITNAPTLAEALDQFIALRTLIGDVDQVLLRRHGDDVEVSYVLEGEGRGAFSAFGNLLLIARLVEQYAGRAASTMRIELTGAAFAPARQLGELGQAARIGVSFGQAANVLRFSADADAAYPLHNPVSYAVLCRQAQADLRMLRLAQSFSFRVEDELTSILRRPLPEPAQQDPLAHLCEQLALSRSGLHRRLQKETTNFQTILADVRLAEARLLLEQSQMALSDISDRLGFSSPSAFSRFFSGHCGSSPSDYRRRRCTA